MKNPHLKILLCFFSLILQLILHCKISEASSIINTASLSSAQGIIFPFSSTTYLVGSSAGDFNHDGYEDIMIAVPTDSSNTGVVYVIFGTSTGIPIVNLNTMSTSEGITIRGPSAASLFGYLVDALGDVNGDHIDDIIIGAYGNNKAYVIFGQSSSLLADIDLSLTTSLTGQGIVLSGPLNSQFGFQVSSAGDFNHDGINDFMVSSPLASGQQGAVYVIFGNQSIPSTFDLTAQTLTSSQGFQIVGEPFSKLGISLSSAGDVNGDNIDDIMMGTDAPTSLSAGGMVLIVYGTQTPVSINIATLSSSQGVIITGTSSSIIGTKGSISSAGDLNNDLIDDLAIGVSTYGGSGLAYIIYGQNGGFTGTIALSPSSLSPSSGFQILGVPNSNSYFEASITSADINGDGRSDLVVSSPEATGPLGTSAGITYVFFGNDYGFLDIDLSSPGPQVLTIYGDNANSKMGLMVKPANDLNSDGLNDLVILGTQEAYIIYGSGCGSALQCSSPTLSPICYASMGCDCAASNEFFQDNQCVTECNQKYYPDNNAICEPCPYLCSSCTGSSTCQICASGFILQGGLCQCPIGYSLNGSTCESNDVNDVDDLGNINTINSIADVTNTVNAASLTAASVVVPQDPGSVTAGMLAKMLQYIKYLNIPYSQRLELSFKDLNSTYGPFGVGPKMPRQAILEAPFHEIPERFVKFNVVSNFLVNFWDNMIFIAIISAVLLMIVAAEFGFAKIKQKPAPSILKLVRLNGQNFFMMQFYNVFGDVLLYITLDFRTVIFSSREAAISFFVSILFTCIGCIILGIHLYILIRFITFRKTPSWTSKIQEFSKNYKDADALIAHFKDSTFISQSFLFVFMIRNCLFNLVLGLLSDFPLLQASLIVAMSAIMLLYLVFQRAFKTIVNLLQHITCELILLIVNICVLIMAQLDFTKADSYVVRDQLSDVIIYTSLIFSFVPETFLAIKLAIAVFDWYKKSTTTQINTGTKSGLGLTIQKRFQNMDGSPSLYGQDDILNDSAVDLNTMQNSSIVNLKTNNSSFIKSLNDSTLQTSQFQQQSMETIPVDNMRGPIQQWNGTSLGGSELRAIRNTSKVIEETNIMNSFFVNNKARERWSRKKIKKNFN